MLQLDDIRAEFARFLHNDPGGRWRMDAALARVVTLAYHQGLTDGAATPPTHPAAPYSLETSMDRLQANPEEILPILGTAMGDGYYAGRIRQDDGQIYALIVAPKADGEHAPAIWIPGNRATPCAKSYNDGLANTRAMAEAGSDLAKWALDLRIGGHDDWYLPSQDELEIIYRNLKPTPEENSCYARSGINLSAVPPTRPYTPEMPEQTLAEAFKAGGDQAFAAEWYWTSTQRASYSDYAWHQTFSHGNQIFNFIDCRCRARAVRRSPI